MIFIPKAVSVTADRGFIMMEFDLIDDKDRVTIENIVISSIESYGLPKFLFFEELDGLPHLYGKSITYKNGHEVTTHISIPASLLSEGIVRRLKDERSLYLKNKELW